MLGMTWGTSTMVAAVQRRPTQGSCKPASACTSSNVVTAAGSSGQTAEPALAVDGMLEQRARAAMARQLAFDWLVFMLVYIWC